MHQHHRGTWLPLITLAAALGAAAPAQADDAGPYAIVAGGRTAYDYDCYFFTDCDSARASTVKLGGGWRFGVFGVEGWVIDWGRSGIRTGENLRLRSLGVGGVWHLSFSNSVQGLLRAGAAQVDHQRSRDSSNSSLSGTFGLGVSFKLNPTLAIDLSWDLAGGEGNNTGTVLAQAFTAGLRVRF